MPAWAPERAVAAALVALAGALGAQAAEAQADGAQADGAQVDGAQVDGARPADLVSSSALRVCADPAAPPSSSEDRQGYENRIAELLGAELGRPVEYTWYPMSTGFIRNTLAAAECDVVIGYAQGDELVLNTNHWLTSAYALVVSADGPLAAVTTLSDPRLAEARIGVVAGTPPATHLARLGLLDRIRSYALFADRRYHSPPDEMLADLDAGEVDAALMWGPIAGPLVKAEHPGLQVTPLLAEPPQPPLVFRITMGVRQGEDDWKRELNSLLRRHQGEIDAILREAGVPVLDDMGTGLKPAG